MVAVHHHSQRPHASSATYHVFTQQHHFIPKSHLVNSGRERGPGGPHNNSRSGGLEAGGSVSSSSSGAGLQKRPTFEALDKRKSWTLEQAPPPPNTALASGSSPALVSNEGRPGSQHHTTNSRISAYQNTHILKDSSVFINNVNSTNSYDPRRKKPVPLPRSKIPVLLPAGLASERPQKSGGGGGRFMGLGPRSKVRVNSFHGQQMQLFGLFLEKGLEF